MTASAERMALGNSRCEDSTAVNVEQAQLVDVQPHRQRCLAINQPGCGLAHSMPSDRRQGVLFAMGLCLGAIFQSFPSPPCAPMGAQHLLYKANCA